jgi:predicted TIM-barrel fold metal-dependent hydrolase
MIIDSHFHLVAEGWIHRDFMIGMGRIATAFAGRATGERADAAQLVDNLLPFITDTTGEKLVAGMDAVGIDMTCIFAVDYALLTGEPGVPIEDQNRMVAEAASRFPDRLIPFFAIDPRREGAADMLARAIEDHGMRGLKFHPTSGYFPHEEFCYPLYETCMEHNVPVLIHTGSQPAPLKFRYAQPIFVDDVAADFPDLPIIMAHVGHQMWNEALLVASVKPNVYFDISGWQLAFNNHPAEFYRMLRRLLDEVGPWRVFFGTDGPYLNVMCPVDTWLKAVKEPDLSSCPDVSFSREELDTILGNSFAMFMGI